MESTFIIRVALPIWLLPNISIDSGSGQSLAFIAAATVAADAWADANGVPDLRMRSPFAEASATKGPGNVSGYHGIMEYSNPDTEHPLAKLDDTLIASLKEYMLANVPEVGVIKVIEPIPSAQSDVRSGAVGTDLLDVDTRAARGGSFQTPTFEIDVEDSSAKFEVVNLAAGKSAEIRQSMNSIDIIKAAALDMSDQNARMHLVTSVEFLASFSGFPSGLFLEWGLLDRWKISMAFDGTANPILRYETTRPDGSEGQNFIWLGPGAFTVDGAFLETWPDKPIIHNINIVSVDRDQDQLRGFSVLTSPGVVNTIETGMFMVESPAGSLLVIRDPNSRLLGVEGEGRASLQRQTKAKDPARQNTTMQTRFLRWVNSGTSEATGTFKIRVHNYKAEASVRHEFLAPKIVTF